MMTRHTLLALLTLTLAAGCGPTAGDGFKFPDGDPTNRSQTPPSGQCVSKPVGFDIRLPFVAGETAYVTAGYGLGNGSSKHGNCTDTGFAMDGFALDLTLENHPSNGLGEPVLAIASGTVVKAGWSTAGWKNYGIRVYIEHDFSDGHRYISVYAHLNATNVTEGQHVEQGDMIGELGGSCTPDGGSPTLSCPYFNPHLHFALHRNSTIGGSGDGGSYGGNGVVPEPFDGYEGIDRYDLLVSGNGNGQPPQPNPNPQPDPDPDPDPPPTTCPAGNGAYCGDASLGLDPSTLYHCTNGNYSVIQHCGNGCHVAPPGSPDYCEPDPDPTPDPDPDPPPTTCPSGNGAYCGDPNLGLDPSTLYHCTNGNYSVLQYCANGCHIAPPGSPDYCNAGAPTTCPFGNGAYCGDASLGLDPNTLYNCTNGNYSVIQWCSNGCHIAPPGSPDYCN